MASHTNQVPWQLFLFGDFKLLDANSAPIHLPSRKVEGLMGILAVNRGRGIERDVIAKALWPGQPSEKRQTSLRQALAQLRKVLGIESVVSSRSHCRLSSALLLVTDIEREEARNSDTFLPGHEGEWFEQARQEIQRGGSNQVPGRDPVIGPFVETLNWFAGNDPVGFFSLLRASISMARSIPHRDLLNLLTLTNEHSECVGWAAFWRGALEDDLHECARLLRVAIGEAKRLDDSQLASASCLELGKVYSRTGQVTKAQKVQQLADSIALQSRSRAAKANAIRLKGTILVNWGDQVAGLELLERTEDLIDDVIDKAIAQSARAFFEASSGEYEKAVRTLESPTKMLSQFGHYRISLTNDMAKAFLEAATGSRDRAMRELHKLAPRHYASGSTQFGVYADELLAKLYYLDGDKPSAERHLKSAREGRIRSQMAVTPLEAGRLVAVR